MTAVQLSMRGQHIESECKARFHRETIRLQDAAGDAAEAANAFPVGSPAWKEAVAKFVEAENNLQAHLASMPK